MNNINNNDNLITNEIISILNEFKKSKSELIPLLQIIQEKYKFISPEAIKLIADYIGITSCEVFGVATFYNQFRFNPPGKHQIKVCLGTACHVKSGDIILENFERKLSIKAGETTEDREYSIDKVACVGCCALAPVTVVDDKVEGKISPSRIEGIFLGFEMEKEKQEKQNNSTE